LIYRPLGSTSLSVSAIGLGCSHLHTRRRAGTRGDLVRLLEHAVDRGITFFDTADVYLAGESERLLGEVLSGRRERVVVATKVGKRNVIPEALLVRLLPFAGSAPRRPGARLTGRGRAWLTRPDLSAGHLRAAVEASLRRLRTDRIDLLQLHTPPAAALDRDGALETLERLAREGKIRFYGLAFATCDEAQAALRDGGLSTLQVPVSAGGPVAIDEILAWARSRGIGVIANQPLRKGALLRDGGAVTLGGAGGTPAQRAIRFAASRPAVSTVIVGTTSIAHLDENVAALDGLPSTADEPVSPREGHAR
jgi:aryl-alcohol dehydrogenase-like predicted oxidoreductase